MFRAVATILVFAAGLPAFAESLRIAAASDLKFAMDEIVTEFSEAHPGNEVEVVYGSSGNFHAQIQQGAPYDMYFSADIEYPRELVKRGFAKEDVRPYAIGRIVLWSTQLDASNLTLLTYPHSMLPGSRSQIPLTRPTESVQKKRFVQPMFGTKFSPSWSTARTSLKPLNLCSRGTLSWESLRCRSRSVRI